jgi:hypothetical protein
MHQNRRRIKDGFRSQLGRCQDDHRQKRVSYHKIIFQSGQFVGFFDGARLDKQFRRISQKPVFGAVG